MAPLIQHSCFSIWTLSNSPKRSCCTCAIGAELQHRKRRWKEIPAVGRAGDRGLTAGSTPRVVLLLWGKGTSKQGLCRAKAKGRGWLRGGKGGGLLQLQGAAGGREMKR